MCNIKDKGSNMKKIRDIWSFIRTHKYAAVIVGFLIIICFTDQNNLIKRIQHQRQIHRLEKEIDYYKKMRDESAKGLLELANDSNNLERIARERYGMHLPNEEVFIIE